MKFTALIMMIRGLSKQDPQQAAGLLRRAESMVARFPAVKDERENGLPRPDWIRFRTSMSILQLSPDVAPEEVPARLTRVWKFIDEESRREGAMPEINPFLRLMWEDVIGFMVRQKNDDMIEIAKEIKDNRARISTLTAILAAMVG
jgi:hypothetical protein